MVKIVVVDRTRLPLVPFIVKVRVPLGACNPTLTVSVGEPELVTEVVLKLAVAVGGKPPR